MICQQEQLLLQGIMPDSAAAGGRRRPGKVLARYCKLLLMCAHLQRGQAGHLVSFLQSCHVLSIDGIGRQRAALRHRIRVHAHAVARRGTLRSLLLLQHRQQRLPRVG